MQVCRGVVDWLDLEIRYNCLALAAFAPSVVD